MTFHTVKIMDNPKKDRKNPKNTVDDRKKVIRNFGRENGNYFLKNVIQKSWSSSPNKGKFDDDDGLRNVFRPPKVGARSPPMGPSVVRLLNAARTILARLIF